MSSPYKMMVEVGVVHKCPRADMKILGTGDEKRGVGGLQR